MRPIILLDDDHSIDMYASAFVLYAYMHMYAYVCEQHFSRFEIKEKKVGGKKIKWRENQWKPWDWTLNA